MEKEVIIAIYWDDLKTEKQDHIKEKLGIKSELEYNWDIFPVSSTTYYTEIDEES